MFTTYRIDGDTMYLYLADLTAEFSAELGLVSPTHEKQQLQQEARRFAKEKGFRGKTIKIMVGAMALTSIVVSNPPTKTAAATQTTQGQTYTVQSGDTLWNLSVKFDTTVAALKSLNGLTSDVLQPGQTLYVPTDVTTTTGTVAPAPTTETVTPPTVAPTTSTYTVKSGDSLSVIAKNFGTTVEAIRAANGLASDVITVGQTLSIPAAGITTTAPAPTPAPAPTTSSYTVKSGDSLSVIAKNFGTTVEAIRVANGLTSDVLRIGQVLTIPAATAGTTPAPTTAPTTSTYTVKSGDSLSVIAKNFGTTVEAIRAANGLTSDILRIGQVLTIPAATGTGTTPTLTPAPTTSTYTVKSGDSLSVIAKNFGTTVEAIRAANGLTSDVLRIGQVLTIPAAATAPTTAIPATYVVMAGDSLWSISQKLGVSVDTLRTANSLTTDTLYVGQVLQTSTTATSTFTALTTAPTTNSITYITHVVRSGDNAWNLSVKYGIPQGELLRANGLTSTSVLSIGQTLKIPVHNIAVKPTVSERHGEYLDWWTEAQYVFTIGKTAKVTDFATGKSFYIKRTIGANHADSETVTVADSTIAKSIWGGYSWTPRAIIVEVDGRKLAASMSFFPHDVEYIKDNGITGHFDVYFGNSTRHKDGLPDAGHQRQVERAAGMTAS